MAQADVLRTLNKIYDDIDPKDNFPSESPLLAHYTSLQVGESIIKEKKLWLSNPLYMNDFEELAFGFNQGKKLVAASGELRASFQNEESFLDFVTAFNDLADNFEDKEALDIFIACFCRHETSDTDGLLSMWRGYGHDGKGLAIIFDTSKIEEPDDSAFILAPVQYASTQDRISYLNSRLKLYAEIIQGIELTRENIILSAYVLFERIKLYSLFTKHVGFKEEREWRIVYLPSNDPTQALRGMIGYHNGARGIEPKMFLEIGAIEGVTAATFEFDDLIHTILLGPNGASALAESSFRRMLSLIKKQKLTGKVRSSQIPYRPLPK